MPDATPPLAPSSLRLPPADLARIDYARQQRYNIEVQAARTNVTASSGIAVTGATVYPGAQAGGRYASSATITLSGIRPIGVATSMAVPQHPLISTRPPAPVDTRAAVTTRSPTTVYGAAQRPLIDTRQSAPLGTLAALEAKSSVAASKIKPPLTASDLKPPVDSPGLWILRANFPAGKSFGAFECERCYNRWISAHSQTYFRQGCRRCEHGSLPKFMWMNTPSSQRRQTREEPEAGGPPHDRSRCEACTAGKCITAQRY